MHGTTDLAMATLLVKAISDLVQVRIELNDTSITAYIFAR
jgi:hypothetical protein